LRQRMDILKEENRLLTKAKKDEQDFKDAEEVD
jgi:hypothetical protein